jgi:hypothetical protein
MKSFAAADLAATLHHERKKPSACNRISGGLSVGAALEIHFSAYLVRIYGGVVTASKR